MTSWGAVLLAAFLYLSLRQPKRRRQAVAPMIAITIVVIGFTAVRHSTL
jgi:hypothetical protein